MNTEESQKYEEMIKQEVAKQMQGEEESHPLRNELFSLGGGVAGAGAGLASINAIDTAKEQISLRHADKQNLDRDALQKMKDIHDGRTTWASVNPQAQPILKEMYLQNAELLKDDQKFKAMMQQLGPQKIHRIGNDSKGKILKRMMPNMSILDNFENSVKHPAVAAGALAGMTGGYYLSRLTDK